MLEGKNILVTAGGTMEYIDDIRVLTNISSGLLGKYISGALLDNDAEVHYVCGKHSLLPDRLDINYLYRVKTAQDAFDAMKKVIDKYPIDAVVHSMAVSDFTFKRDIPVKCKSSDLDGFIEYMRQTIMPNPKIISQIKQWKKDITLVGFKFEVGKTVEELEILARDSILKNGCDLVVTNDKKEMEKYGEHVAHLVLSEYATKKLPEQYSYLSNKYTCEGKPSIAGAISDFLDGMLT